MNTLDDLLVAIAGAPSLPGARCRGRHHLFDCGTGEDPDIVEQRHAQALSLCHHCPALQRCQTWLADLPKSKRPDGVVAGRIVVADKPNRDEVRADRAELFTALRRTGMSFRAIAAATDASEPTVRRALRAEQWSD